MLPCPALLSALGRVSVPRLPPPLSRGGRADVPRTGHRSWLPHQLCPPAWLHLGVPPLSECLRHTRPDAASGPAGLSSLCPHHPRSSASVRAVTLPPKRPLSPLSPALSLQPESGPSSCLHLIPLTAPQTVLAEARGSFRYKVFRVINLMAVACPLGRTIKCHWGPNPRRSRQHPPRGRCPRSTPLMPWDTSRLPPSLHSFWTLPCPPKPVPVAWTLPLLPEHAPGPLHLLSWLFSGSAVSAIPISAQTWPLSRPDCSPRGVTHCVYFLSPVCEP